MHVVFPRDWLRKIPETKLTRVVINDDNLNQKKSGALSLDWGRTHIQLVISPLFYSVVLTWGAKPSPVEY